MYKQRSLYRREVVAVAVSGMRVAVIAVAKRLHPRVNL